MTSINDHGPQNCPDYPVSSVQYYTAPTKTRLNSFPDIVVLDTEKYQAEEKLEVH